MRFEGTVKSWNDERGFGFIEPELGGQEIFVHITAFPSRSQPPPLNQRVTFEVELNREGKKRARNVAPVRSLIARVVRPRRTTAKGGAASLVAFAAFALLYLVVAILWRVPNMVAIGYAALSAICFLAYVIDKHSAKSGGWRTKESTLLLLGLVGGWPGAMLAQQLLRHKSIKTSFRVAFWFTVALNVIAFVVLSSPRIGAWSLLRSAW